MLLVVQILESTARRKIRPFLLMLPILRHRVLGDTQVLDSVRILASCSVPSTVLPAGGSGQQWF